MGKIRKDALYQEYLELSQQLYGINPNLSVCKGIKKRMDEIKKELDDKLIPSNKKEVKSKVKRYTAPHHYVHG